MFVDMSINQRGRTAKKKTHMSSRRVSDSGRTKELLCNQYVLPVLFDSGLSFGVKEILLMLLSSAVQIYILKGNSWPFSPPHLIVKMYQ